jgi:anti-repressor protein
VHNSFLAIASALPIATECDEPTVDIRALHSFLEVGTRINDWFTRRAREYDFQIYGFNAETNPYSDLSKKKFRIPLDMAKELCMLEGNEKGTHARRYLLECEKRAKAAPAIVDLNDPKTLRMMLLGHLEKEEALASKIALDAPKVEFAEAVSASDTDMLLSDFGKILSRSIKTGPRKCIERMEAEGYIFHRGKSLRAYQKWIEAGYFRLVEDSYNHPKTGDKIITERTMITGRGQQWIFGRWKVPQENFLALQ